MCHFPSCCSLAFGLAIGLLPTLAEDGRWAEFQNGGQLSLKVDAAVWSKNLVTVWASDIEGHGQSSPVVWDGQVYVTSVVGPMKDTYRLVAYAVESGEEIWRHEVANPSPRESNFYVSRAAPTPAADESGVIAFFEGGVVSALDHAGKERWSRDLVADYGSVKTQFGLSASVEQSDDLAFIWVERSEEPYIVALSKTTGETVWKSDGVGATAWSSPRLVPVEGGVHLVLSGDGSLTGLDPASGDVLWTLTGLSGNTSPSPMPAGTGQFLIGASAGRSSEVADSVFESNGLVSVMRGDDGQWTASFAWTGERTSVSFSSPIMHQGLAYFVNRSGVLTTVDGETGKKVYASRLKGTLWGTPIGVGQLVFMPIKEGSIQILAAGPNFESIATHQLVEAPEKPTEGARGRFGGPIVYGAALASDRLFVRTGEQLFCVTPTYE